MVRVWTRSSPIRLASSGTQIASNLPATTQVSRCSGTLRRKQATQSPLRAPQPVRGGGHQGGGAALAGSALFHGRAQEDTWHIGGATGGLRFDLGAARVQGADRFVRAFASRQEIFGGPPPVLDAKMLTHIRQQAGGAKTFLE